MHDVFLSAQQLCAAQFNRLVAMAFSTVFVGIGSKLTALTFFLSLLYAPPARAAPSCGLENWITHLNVAANTYVNALGTQDQVSAERAFRAQMERYSRKQLVDQINEAGLGANKDALESFILARRHLYDLSRDEWSQMAARFGRDPQFIKQSQSMNAFLQDTECDPFAEDFLSPTETGASVWERLQKGVSKLTSTFDKTPADDDDAQSALTFDPDNFDAFRAERYNTHSKTIQLSPSVNTPIFLGLFTFVVSASIWVWMRIRIVHRRDERYPCSFPIVIFDGSALWENFVI
jgi:hypothetical protein